MPNFAQATIVGHLGKGPEQRGQFTSVNVAVGKKKKDGSKTTTWWRVSCYGRDGESLMKLNKGDAAMFIGEPELTEYTTKDGIVNKSLDLSFARVVFITSKSESERAQQERPAGGNFPPNDDDLNF